MCGPSQERAHALSTKDACSQVQSGRQSEQPVIKWKSYKGTACLLYDLIAYTVSQLPKKKVKKFTEHSGRQALFIYTCLPSANNCRVAADVGMVKNSFDPPKRCKNSACVRTKREAQLQNHWLGIPFDHIHLLVCIGAFSLDPKQVNCTNQEPTEGENIILNNAALVVVADLQLCTPQDFPRKRMWQQSSECTL